MPRKSTTEARPAVSVDPAAVPVKHRTSRPRTPKTVKPAPVTETEVRPEPAQASLISPAPDVETQREEIARIAYSYWEARGRQHGNDEEDWLRAEQEYRSRLSR